MAVELSAWIEKKAFKSPLRLTPLGADMTSRKLLMLITVLVMVVTPKVSEAATRMEIDANVSRTIQNFERQI